MSRGLKYASVAVLALATISGVAYFDGRYHAATVGDAQTHFQLLDTLRRSALETYLNTARAELSFWSVSPRIHESTEALDQAWSDLGPEARASARKLYILKHANIRVPSAVVDAGDGSDYSRAHGELHSLAREFVTERGYYDFFLVDLKGNVIYSVEKEKDFGTNLTTGPYSDSGLASVFRQATREQAGDDVVLSDLSRYQPSNDEPAMFAGKLMRDGGGNPIGLLALQLPVDEIARIMQFTSGMGASGETYLVGEDLLMRSDSRFSDESTILETKVDTETVRLALQGSRGVDFTTDYRGVPVLSAYDFIDFNGIRWAVMSEIDQLEVENSLGNIRVSLAAAGLALFSLVLSTIWALSGGLLSDPDAFGIDVGDVDVDMDAG